MTHIRRRMSYLVIVAALVGCAIGGHAYYRRFGWPKFHWPTTWNDSRSSERSIAISPSSRKIVCRGIVESADGDVQVCAQVSGEIVSLNVTEGDVVQKGDLLVQIDDRVPRAEIRVAESEVAAAEAGLDRIRAGPGHEEIEEARFAVQVTQAELEYEKINLARLRQLHRTNSVALSDMQHSESRVKSLQQKVKSQQKRYEALVRGPLPETIRVAEAEIERAKARLAQAKVHCGYYTIRAPVDGVVVQLYRHTGDSVSTDEWSPIVEIVTSGRLRIRLEIDEIDVPSVQPGMEGVFRIEGVEEEIGQLQIKTVIPHFGPKRLFEADRSARLDTRTLFALATIDSLSRPLYSGQRVTAWLQPVEDEVPGDGDRSLFSTRRTDAAVETCAEDSKEIRAEAGTD